MRESALRTQFSLRLPGLDSPTFGSPESRGVDYITFDVRFLFS
ncbi:hypothetical protein RSSM_01069 [Rhodopirellula sallentina SM41]|uniref:Uncharacterized protein n=1 Tax=Rhodopirellula sallentina SM41 TaxID=1263870 RepID=M5U7N8_9BACT|nr:hypothetical protein RSSM_01069 [Rhodopirellula sallentina SM41]